MFDEFPRWYTGCPRIGETTLVRDKKNWCWEMAFWESALFVWETKPVTISNPVSLGNFEKTDFFTSKVLFLFETRENVIKIVKLGMLVKFQ